MPSLLLTATLTQLSSIDKRVTDLCLLEPFFFSIKDLRNVFIIFSVGFFLPFRKKLTILHFYPLLYLPSHPSCSSQQQTTESTSCTCEVLENGIFFIISHCKLQCNNAEYCSRLHCTPQMPVLCLSGKVNCSSTWTEVSNEVEFS